MDEGILDIYNKSLELNHKRVSDGLSEHKKDLATIYQNKGRALINFERYDDAIKDFTRAIEIYDDLKSNNEDYDINLLAEAYKNRGKSYSYSDKHWNAIKDFSESINILEKIESDKKVLAENYRDRGMSFMEIEKPQKSIENYRKAIDIYKQIIESGEDFDYNQYAALYMSEGITLLMLKKYQESLIALDKAYVLQKDLYDKGELLDIPVIITTLRSRIVANTKLNSLIEVNRDENLIKEFMKKIF